ncbi:MAG: acetyl-CoA carboxylase carboxyltransferase subunit alpha [Pirellulaceae bacterium]|nr:acetyl-CoA carboxylase carboxyltransferase subunit alpha [Pirellulaceae bacterium]
MNSPLPGMEFEQPIFDLEMKLREVETNQEGISDAVEQASQLRRAIAEKTKEIYAQLSNWEIVRVARHPDRPHTEDYLGTVFDEFVELHGDRHFGDDRAIISGFAKIEEFKVLVIGHQKGRTTKERTEKNFGCAQPEGYRKAMAKMRMAAKYGLPVISLIDTPGAYPGVGAEERGQASVIAESMFEMSRLNTPIICVVIGEGGSGGALGIGVGDRVAILENAYYSVISPEGCAGILWKSGSYAEEAAKALRFTAPSLKKFGVVNDIIEEPLGGAQRDPQQMSLRLKMYLAKTLRELTAIPREEIADLRYEKFRRMGVFLENPLELSAPE